MKNRGPDSLLQGQPADVVAAVCASKCRCRARSTRSRVTVRLPLRLLRGVDRSDLRADRGDALALAGHDLELVATVEDAAQRASIPLELPKFPRVTRRDCDQRRRARRLWLLLPRVSRRLASPGQQRCSRSAPCAGGIARCRTGIGLANRKSLMLSQPADTRAAPPVVMVAVAIPARPGKPALAVVTCAAPTRCDRRFAARPGVRVDDGDVRSWLGRSDSRRGA